jgi:HEAT repeat protein
MLVSQKGIPLIKQKLNSKRWEERRFAAFAIASIGTTDVSLIEETITQLFEYAAKPEKVRNDLRAYLKYDQFVPQSIEFDPVTMLRDACIDALGEIGKNFPKSVEFSLPLLESLSKNAPSPYTMKKAGRAIEAIKGIYKGNFKHLV